ncbi:energy transducer TonB family protein [Mucilaginibacter sp.]
MMYKKLIYSLWMWLLPFCVLAQPQFKGGAGALDTYLTKNIIYPDYSRQYCIGGTIRVAFKLNSAGKVYDVTVQQGLGIDLDDEARRVVRMTSGKWALPQGYEGNATLVLPVTFTPDYARCTRANQVSSAQAIQNYQLRQEQENAVTNYYKNKYAGKADTSRQAYIDRLKTQLGYDEDFITNVLEQADARQRQGDKEGACETWQFIRNIGSNRADQFIARYCGK